MIAKPVQRPSQGSTPFLIPAWVPARITAAIAAPALDPMHATPRAVLEDFDFVSRRILLEKLSVVGKLCQVVGLNMVQSVRQGHLPKVMVVTITFAICGDVHQFRPAALVRESAHHPFCELLAIVQQTLEGNRFRNRSVV